MTERRRFHGILAGVVFALATLVLAELAARVFWRVGYGIPLSRPATVLYAVYPELWQMSWKDEDVRDQHPLRVLFLGGSALNPAWGNVEKEVQERLTVELERPVVIYNMAEIGHTSRDSLVKYRALAANRFDLVVFYHGINDARANNVPPERYRPDYSHYAWYDTVNALEARPGGRWIVLPATLRFLAVRAKDTLGLADYLTMDAPRPDWLQYGADIKTAASFESNLREIVALASERQETLLVMTFATYVPAGYTPEAFRERKLGYTLHLSPIEMWGTPANVLSAVLRHNEVVRRVAESDARIRFVDQASEMPAEGRYFNDVCHLTAAGSHVFVDNMLATAVISLAKAPRR